MRIRFNVHKNGYRGASGAVGMLVEALGAAMLRRTGSTYRPRAGDLVVNWGSTECPSFAPARMLNNPDSVSRAVNKTTCLSILRTAQVPTVEWTQERSVAERWLRNSTVFVRQQTSASRGRGILVRTNSDGLGPLPEARLYTRHFNGRYEYRVHVVRGEVIDVQQKKRRRGAARNLVRSYANGYVYCRGGVEAPESVKQASLDAVRALGLDFGAVDILCKQDGTCAVLEVNTAPGIEGTTVEKYAEAIRRAADDS